MSVWQWRGDARHYPELMPLQNLNPSYISREDSQKNVSLVSLFEELDLSPFWHLVRKRYALNGWTRTLDWKALFRAAILKEMWQIDSRRKLVKLLEKDDRLLKLCRLDNPPDHSTFSKFLKRIGSEAFEDIFSAMVEQLADLEEVGETVAVDSTMLEAYSNNYGPYSDPDAEWGYCAARKRFEFGYKVHLACDAGSELPLAFTVTPANVYDSIEYLALMEILKTRGINPKFVLADKGYDTKDNILLTVDRYGATPIIAMNKRRSKSLERDWERDLSIKRNSEEWKNLYNKRSSIERIFSRLKENLDLKSVKVRGLDRVRIHVTFSLVTMLAVALAAQKTGNESLSTSINSFRF